MKRYQPLLSLIGIVGGLLLALPVKAAQFEDWTFDTQQNRLVFTTSGPVQPRAQFLFSPPRIILDLPGTTITQATASQVLGNNVGTLHIEQLDAQTTRLIIELSPDYSIDPTELVIRGENGQLSQSSQQWFLDLPVLAVTNEELSPQISTDFGTVGAPATQVESLSVTPDGFFLRTSGDTPLVNVDPIDSSQVMLRVENATAATSLLEQTIPANALGVSQWAVEQVTTSNGPTLEITLTVPETATEWTTFVSSGVSNGIVLLPPRDMAIATATLPNPTPTATLPPPVSPPSVAAPSLPRPPQPLPTPTNPAIPPPSINPSLQNITIVIDPGHGGRDPGAIGVGGLQEKDVVSAISYEVASILEQAGATVVLTRSTDLEIDLDPRVQIAERADADLFVSIHANSISLERPDVNGFETYYYSSGLSLAQSIHGSVLQRINMPDRGVRRARFYVLKNTSMPAVLVETGFVTGEQDSENFNDPEWLSQMAEAIATGVIQYVQQAS